MGTGIPRTIRMTPNVTQRKHDHLWNSSSLQRVLLLLYHHLTKEVLMHALLHAGSSYDTTDNTSVIYRYDLEMYYCYLDVWISFYRCDGLCQHLYVFVTFPRENIFVFSLNIPTPECGKGVFAIVHPERCFDAYQKSKHFCRWQCCVQYSLTLYQTTKCLLGMSST